MGEEASCCEFLAFQKSYTTLLSLSSGIESISTETWAKALIGRDLKNKCLDKKLSEEERTRCFLKFMEEKILRQPEAFQQLVKIIEDTSGLEYIAKTLLEKLEEAKKERKQDFLPVSATNQEKLDWIEDFRDTNVLVKAQSTMKLSSFQPFSAHEEGRRASCTPPPTATQSPVAQRRKSELFTKSCLALHPLPQIPPFYDHISGKPNDLATSAPRSRHDVEATDSTGNSTETLKPKADSDEFFTPPGSLSQSSSSSTDAAEENREKSLYQSNFEQQNMIARLQDENRKLKQMNEEQVSRMKEELFQQKAKYYELENNASILFCENQWLRQQFEQKRTFTAGDGNFQNYTHPTADQHLTKIYIQKLERENQALKSQLSYERGEKLKALWHHTSMLSIAIGNTQPPHNQPTHLPSGNTATNSGTQRQPHDESDYHLPTTEAQPETERTDVEESRGESTSRRCPETPKFAYH